MEIRFFLVQVLLKKKSDIFKIVLLGGEIREITQAFVGEITNALMDRMYFSKMFFSGNGIVDGRVITSSFEEDFTKKLALERSPETDLLIDSSKSGGRRFCFICSLKKVTAVITDDSTEQNYGELEIYTQVIV